jgi:predicted RNA-binding Zn-ribbon protein involved in translation (DUF1610 family)
MGETRGKWHAAYFCVACGEELSSDEVMYSSGVCPWCGHVSNTTVCRTETRVRRWVGGGVPWWHRLLGWVTGHWEYREKA